MYLYTYYSQSVARKYCDKSSTLSHSCIIETKHIVRKKCNECIFMQRVACTLRKEKERERQKDREKAREHAMRTADVKDVVGNSARLSRHMYKNSLGKQRVTNKPRYAYATDGSF